MSQARFHFTRVSRHPRLRAAGAIMFVLVLLIVAAAAGRARAQTNHTAGGQSAAAAQSATFALSPGGKPDSILPFNTINVYTNVNIFNLQYMLYRPLYWFGQNGKVQWNPGLSIGAAPKYSNGGKTVTVKLKSWQWSDGTPVTSRDVAFWINILKFNKKQWGGYVGGEFPDDLVRESYPNASTVVLTFNKAYNHNWLLYNQLSLIIPMPQHAWDRTSSSAPVGNADETAAGAAKVLKYLEGQSAKLSAYTTNPLWKVADGPWLISTYNSATGAISFNRNTHYSGPVTGKLQTFTELPYTSEFSEYAALKSGQLDYGYLPVQNFPAAGSLKKSGYSVVSWPSWGIGYQGLNFTNPVTGPILKQLYVRQALAHVVDQTGIVKFIMHGFGYPTYGPVPVVPPSSFVDSFEKHDPYPYSTSAAAKLLTTHGWTKNSSGVYSCTRPGTAKNECGAGIKSGAVMSFSDQYSSGVTVLDEVMQTFRSDAAKAGIQIKLESAPQSEVYGSYAPCKAGQKCTWDIKDYSTGGDTFTYSPWFYPTGEIIFSSGLGGDYSSATANKLIAGTLTGTGLGPLNRYENYIAAQLPYLWMPVTPSQISVVKSKIHGALPQDPDLEIYPEDWTIGS